MGRTSSGSAADPPWCRATFAHSPEDEWANVIKPDPDGPGKDSCSAGPSRNLALTGAPGAAVAIIPLVAFALFLQRFWKLDLLTEGLKR